MTAFLVHGGTQLKGDIFIQGSKNAVLPMLAASLLNKGETRLYGCPRISDVYHMIHILQHLGCEVIFENHYIEIHSQSARFQPIGQDDASQIRSSIFLMGALLGRFKEVDLPFPGGCSIGQRAIDIHIEALRQMNITLMESENNIYGCTEKIFGANISLRYPSVGATENIILAAVSAIGKTVISNAAKEPEIIDLCLMLNKMGADIHGMGTSNITIYGVNDLKDVEFTMSADRIVASTYLMAAAGTCGDVRVMNVWEHDIKSVLQILAQIGCGIVVQNKRVRVIGPQVMIHVDDVHTRPFPGFPTDVQSQLMACLTMARGESKIYEHIFESRFKIVPELQKMGAKIKVNDHCVVIDGVSQLQGSAVDAKDLRGGAGLIIAGLMAEGDTVINNSKFIKRGYEDICADLNMLGASVSEFSAKEGN